MFCDWSRPVHTGVCTLKLAICTSSSVAIAKESLENDSIANLDI